MAMHIISQSGMEHEQRVMADNGLQVESFGKSFVEVDIFARLRH